MERKHFYKNYEEVISILTKDYGFSYNGIGDNAEECFTKDSDTPETIFIHPMFCSYYKASSREISASRLYDFNSNSDHKNERSQTIAFQKLVIHLNEVALQEDAAGAVMIQKILNPQPVVLNSTPITESKKLTFWQRLWR